MNRAKASEIAEPLENWPKKCLITDTDKRIKALETRRAIAARNSVVEMGSLLFCMNRSFLSMLGLDCRLNPIDP